MGKVRLPAQALTRPRTKGHDTDMDEKRAFAELYFRDLLAAGLSRDYIAETFRIADASRFDHDA